MPRITICLVDTGRTFDNGGSVLRFWRRFHELEGVQDEQRNDSLDPYSSRISAGVDRSDHHHNRQGRIQEASLRHATRDCQLDQHHLSGCDSRVRLRRYL